MKVISTRTHGVLDYGVGLILAASPWILGFSDSRPATLVMVVLGLGAVVYSLITKYELGLIRVSPMNAHLAIDLMSGAFLMASPWVLGFASHVYWPHLVFGVLEICVVAMTPWHFGRARHLAVGHARPA